MKYVTNVEGKLVSADFVKEQGLRNNNFRCPDCGEVVIACFGSINAAHFKHHPNPSCNGKKNSPEIVAYAERKKSVFHQHWQEIFPGNCTERQIENKRADILLMSDTSFNIVTEHGDKIIKDCDPDNLVIEIQYSNISADEVLSRENVYRNKEAKRDILWIYDATQVKSVIYYLMSDNKYQVEFPWGCNRFPLDNSANVLLDKGGENLYHLTKQIQPNRYDITIIKRADFLKQLSPIAGIILEWKWDLIKDEIEKYTVPKPIITSLTLPIHCESKDNVVSKCKGDGECLMQKDDDTYYRGYPCESNCRPIRCPNYLICKKELPQWVLNCHSGKCHSCNMNKFTLTNERNFCGTCNQINIKVLLSCGHYICKECIRYGFNNFCCAYCKPRYNKSRFRSCTDCGKKIKPRYTKCYACH